MKAVRKDKRDDFRWFGLFDWRHDFTRSNKYWRYESEEEFLNSICAKHRENYLKGRVKKEANWKLTKRYQRHLRMTLIKLKKIEDAKNKALRKRYITKKLDNTVIPAELFALMEVVHISELEK